MTITSTISKGTGMEKASKGEVTLKAWEYIHEKGLRVPRDSKYIFSDRFLKAIINKKRAPDFDVANYVNQNILD